MKMFVALYRLLIAAAVAIGVSDLWVLGKVNKLVFFTFQTNLVIAFVMIWSAIALLIKGKQPPVWLKGCLVLYITITGLVSYFILPPSDPLTTRFVFGIMVSDYLHKIVPIAMVIDYLLFDPHRRFRWHYALSWLTYFPFYIVFVLIRGHLFHNAGPGPGGSSYPYFFMNVDALGWSGIAKNTAIYIGAFFVMSALLVLIDRLLPAKTPLSVSV